MNHYRHIKNLPKRKQKIAAPNCNFCFNSFFLVFGITHASITSMLKFLVTKDFDSLSKWKIILATKYPTVEKENMIEFQYTLEWIVFIIINITIGINVNCFNSCFFYYLACSAEFGVYGIANHLRATMCRR